MVQVSLSQSRFGLFIIESAWQGSVNVAIGPLRFAFTL